MGVDKPAEGRRRLIGELVHGAAFSGPKYGPDPAFCNAVGYLVSHWVGDPHRDQIRRLAVFTEFSDDFAGSGSCTVAGQCQHEGIFTWWGRQLDAGRTPRGD